MCVCVRDAVVSFNKILEHRSVKQNCRTSVSCKSVLEECHPGTSFKIQECAWRRLIKSVKKTVVIGVPSVPQEPLVAFLLLVVRPGAPSSVLAPSSKARSP